MRSPYLFLILLCEDSLCYLELVLLFTNIMSARLTYGLFISSQAFLHRPSITILKIITSQISLVMCLLQKTKMSYKRIWTPSKNYTNTYRIMDKQLKAQRKNRI